MSEHRLFLTAFFLAVGYFIIRLYEPFIMVIAISSLLAIATHKIHVKIERLIKNRIASALLSTILLSLLFFAPIVYTLTSIGGIVHDFDPAIVNKTVEYVKNFDYQLPDSIAFLQPKISELLDELRLGNLMNSAMSYAGSIGKNSAGFLKDMLLIVIFFFFILLNGKELSEYIKSVMPMQSDEVNFIFTEVTNVMSVVFYSILVTAIFEGALFAVLGMHFGYNGLFLGILYGFASLIPIVGGALMWIPLCAYELANGNVMEAIVIALYSIIVISIVADTFIKPMIIKYINTKLVKIPTVINEMLIFFAILAGLSTFGFWGMILGPAITTLFISLLKLYKLLKEKHYM
ncbi:MAG: AI-2E family transporter [Sulfurospirillaceae bacterium]|nr:AI-2E family transporter [Sulfurospirillaceae bacterium]